MSVQSVVACPDCGSDIHIDSVLLLGGAKFQCTNPQCGVSISIAGESVSAAKAAIEEFEKLKGQAILNAQSSDGNDLGDFLSGR